MSVLLIQPAYHRPHFDKVVAGLPNIGLLSLAAVAQNEGHETTMLDADIDRLSMNALRARLRALTFAPDWIGISVATTLFNSSLETARICREEFPAARIVLGGPHPTLLPDSCLNNEIIDVVVRNEGEEAFLDLISGKPLEGITGISHRSNQKIIHNELRPMIRDLDSLPFPAYGLIDLQKYRPGVGNYLRLPAMPIITSRGCSGRCTFCCTHLFGRKFRFMSPERVLEQITLLVSQFGIREITFYDDAFTLHRNRAVKICELLRRSKLDVTWACLCRADQVNKEILTEMKSAGCHTVGFGGESGDDAMLQRIKKGISTADTFQAVQWCRQVGLRSRVSFIYGHIFDTPETMKRTFQFARKLDADHTLFTILAPLPDSEDYRYVVANDLFTVPDPWDHLNISTPVVKYPYVSSDEVKRYCYTSRKYFYRKYVRKHAGVIPGLPIIAWNQEESMQRAETG